MAKSIDPIERVKQSDGDLVLDYHARIGARPYARYVDGEWDIMSLSYVPTPAYGMSTPDEEIPYDTRVHTVDLEPDDIPETALREMARQPLRSDDDGTWLGVEVITYEESPFPDRNKIPAKEDIVQTQQCPDCDEEFRQYCPDPFTECPHCGVGVESVCGER